jgi:hypothetical protein
MSQNKYQGRKIAKIHQVIIKSVFKIVFKLFFISGKYSQITRAIKKKTSYLNHKKLDNFGSQNGRKINAKEINTKVVVTQRI